jgi:AraC-like DNA-binding protein/quercetin dioxygenase-like cupin family protein
MITSNYIKNNNYFSLTKTWYQKGHICPPHHHKDVSISIVLNGIVQEEVNSELKVGKSAVTIIKPAEIIHQNLFTEDCLILCLQLKDISRNKLKSNSVLEEWAWMNGLNCLPYFSQILQSKTEKQIYENSSALLQYIKSSNPENEILKIPDWLADIKAFIDAYWDESINVTAIARKYKIHRVYLARIFHKFYGQSIKSYLKALRIHHSAAAIINGHSLSDSALRNGFSDQSHLQRSFRQQLSQTPLEFKNLFM